ncbi:MAG TPA: hypothetical protein DDX39_02185 [Bacteroidales bacterium]|nr:MAG: hypothetical protein A2W98_08805 [Bacteroidetes bacterium GWF2_33_38]OFY73843.1 MAG: hypothetical protein A2265_02535 [Bacteroidetes bacterium RIFOXYA12_FULL_33_9]OFY84990.1 MAG: hypothetical protein A2236_03220 [Bacteroidetes bacterium RIFOXYA2_FULL_33_7]HBF87423.1 hypothetical protein [Bacteroidales bacterium]
MKEEIKSEILIRGLLNNDTKVFDYIVKKIKPSIIKHIRKKKVSKNEAEEVFQISMIKIFDVLRNNGNIEKFEPYLLKTCLNTLIDRVVERQKEEDKNEKYYKSIIEQLEEDEAFIEIIREVFSKLDKGCREIFQMKADGMNLNEIAEKLGYTERYLITKKARCKERYLKILNRMK